jgi:hypothetical protein
VERRVAEPRKKWITSRKGPGEEAVSAARLPRSEFSSGGAFFILGAAPSLRLVGTARVGAARNADTRGALPRAIKQLGGRGRASALIAAPKTRQEVETRALGGGFPGAGGRRAQLRLDNFKRNADGGAAAAAWRRRR